MENVLFIAFNHKELSTEQKEDFVKTFGPTKFVHLATLGANGKRLQDQLKNVPPHMAKSKIHGLASNILDFAESVKATHCYVQTAHGLSIVANTSLADNGMVPVEVCTNRYTEETKLPNGKVEKKSIFEHIAWREIF